MWNNPQLYMVLGAALGATLVGLKNADRTYRLRKERKRRQHVAKLARQRGLTLLDESVPEHIQSRADLYRGDECEARVSDLILGKDVEGTYYVARRHVEQDQHYMLCFDTKVGSNLEGFRIETLREDVPRENPLTRIWHRVRGARPVDWHLRMVWDMQARQGIDDATLSTVGAILRHTLGIAGAPGGMVLGVSIEHRQILIHSTLLGGLEDLDSFLENAVSLRLDLIASVRDSSATRPVNVANTVRGDLAAAARKTQRPTPARETPPVAPPKALSPGSMAQPAPGPALKQAAAGRDTPPPPARVAMGLSTPRSRTDSGSWGWKIRNGKRVFEVPEPEEDVVVYVGHGR